MQHVSCGRGHGCERDCGAGSLALRESAHDRGGDAAEQSRASAALAGESAAGEAGQPHARRESRVRRSRRAGRLSRDAAMSAQTPAFDGEWLDEAATRERLARTWNDAPGLWGW